MDIRKKKQKKVNTDCGDKPEEGDAWIHTSVKRGSYFFAAFSIGKWTQNTCNELVENLSNVTLKPSEECRLKVFTDGNDCYNYALPKYYPLEFIDYGQLVKIKKKGRLVDKIKRVVYGNPSLDEIETTDIENHNGIFRERCGRLVRKTKCFSKKKEKLVCAVQLFKFHWNFGKEIKRRESPGMMEGLADHVFTWHEFFYFRLTILD